MAPIVVRLTGTLCGLPGRCANRRYAVAVLSLGRADESISDQRQSLSCRRTGLAPSGWIGGKVGRLIPGLERDDEDVVLSFVSVASTDEAVPIEGKVAMTAAFVGLWAARRGDRPSSLRRRAVATQSAGWPWFTSRRYEAPCDPDGHELATCPLGSFRDWMEGKPITRPRMSRSADEGRPARPDQARSKRSRFMTLSQAATKSRTNFCCASSLA